MSAAYQISLRVADDLGNHPFALWVKAYCICERFLDRVKEDKRASVVAYHELVLLCLQPSAACWDFLFAPIRGVGEATCDLANGVFWVDASAVPDKHRAVGTARADRQKQVLEWMVLKVPDCLSIVSIGPDTDTVILAIKRVSILVNVRDVRDVPDSDAAFVTGREDQVLVFGGPSLLIETCDGKKWAGVPSQSQVGLNVTIAFLVR